LKSDISYVNSSIKLNFNQSANVNLKPRKRCVKIKSAKAVYSEIQITTFLKVCGVSDPFYWPYHLYLRFNKFFDYAVMFSLFFTKSTKIFVRIEDWITQSTYTCILNILYWITSCSFKVVTILIRNLFRVRLPYLLLVCR
jgi:hypothetical protein